MKPWRSEKKQRWIAGQPCVICLNPDTQAAHVRPDNHKDRGGMGMKGSDVYMVPLCIHGHHAQYDGQRLPNGLVGKAAFAAFYRIDMQAKANEFHARWAAETGQKEAA